MENKKTKNLITMEKQNCYSKKYMCASAILRLMYTAVKQYTKVPNSHAMAIVKTYVT